MQEVTPMHEHERPGGRDDADTASRLRLVIMRLTRRLRREAGDDLSPSVVSALATLDRRGPLTLGQLAELEGVRPPTITRMVATLERLGLVVRENDPADRRVTRLTVSGEGRSRLQTSRTRKTAYLARRLATLDDAEVARVGDALGILERFIESDR
jgi:DNA-binding MarR family transcriptional regulator